jgi:hypothetical protein
MTEEKRWICPECGEEFRNDILRCTCGYEGDAVFGCKTDSFEQIENNIETKKEYRPYRQTHRHHTFGFGLLNSLAFFMPIYNIYILVNITKGRDRRFLLVGLLLGLVWLSIFSNLSPNHRVAIAGVFWGLVFWLIYMQSNLRYAIGNIVGVVLVNVLLFILVFVL